MITIRLENIYIMINKNCLFKYCCVCPFICFVSVSVCSCGWWWWWWWWQCERVTIQLMNYFKLTIQWLWNCVHTRTPFNTQLTWFVCVWVCCVRAPLCGYFHKVFTISHISFCWRSVCYIKYVIAPNALNGCSSVWVSSSLYFIFHRSALSILTHV